MRKTLTFALIASLAGGVLAPSAALAFLHDDHGHGGHGGHSGGCFVTTSPAHNTKGIRHWRNPCPHHERKHLNPYHPGHHRPHHPHPAPH